MLGDGLDPWAADGEHQAEETFLLTVRISVEFSRENLPESFACSAVTFS
jgi:hypothetical protein